MRDGSRRPAGKQANQNRGCFWFEPIMFSVRNTYPATLSSESSFTLLVRSARAKEVYHPKGWPINIREIEFAMHALPQQEAGQSNLSTGPNEEIGIGRARHIKVPTDRCRCDSLNGVG